jgi:hypothetical protein
MMREVMKFFKENFDVILKLLINQVGVALLTFFLYTAAGGIISEGSLGLLIKVAISIFGIIFYFALVYNIAWEIGAKDKIRIDGNKMLPVPNKGILLGIFANSTNIIVIGFATLIFILYILTDAEGLFSIYAVLNFIYRFFISMYLGVIQAICSPYAEYHTELYTISQCICFLIFSLISTIVIHFSYTMGTKDIRIFRSKPQSRYD